MDGICVPLPAGVGYCIEHGANVAITERGHCPEHRTLAIHPEGRPRPTPWVTPTLLLALNTQVLDSESKQGRHCQTANVRQMRARRR